MNEIATVKEQIEEIRRELDKAAVENMTDGNFYLLSLKMDSLIEKYLNLCEPE